MNSLEVPPSISQIKPEQVNIFLKDYASEGIGLSSSEFMEQFCFDCLHRLQEIPDTCETPPRIFIMDFSEVSQLDPENFRVGFNFLLENLRGVRNGQLKRVYSVFTNLSEESLLFESPMQVFKQVVEKDAQKPVVMVSGQSSKYDLVGNKSKIELYGQAWVELMKAVGWVYGSAFARDKLDLPQVALLHCLHKEGLALKGKYEHKSYFRSLV